MPKLLWHLLAPLLACLIAFQPCLGVPIANAGNLPYDGRMITERCDQTYEGTDGVEDVFDDITWSWQAHDCILNFNVDEDILDLRPFYFPNRSYYDYDQIDADNNAMVTVPSNGPQTITLEDVASTDLSLGENLLDGLDNGGGGTLPPEGNFPIEGVDDDDFIALQVTVERGTTIFTIDYQPSSGTLSVLTNNGSLLKPSIENSGDNKSILTLETTGPGRGSIMIKDETTNATRFLGVRVKNADGSIPGLPDTYLPMGSVSEDSTADLSFWQDFAEDLTNKRMDVRYIYLNGGASDSPFCDGCGNWRTWGERLQSFVRESLKLGMVPYFVWYNIPDGGESYYTDKRNMQNQQYMESYFKDLKYALEEIVKITDEPVGMVLEPDFIGYMAQNAASMGDGDTPNKILAMTSAAYDAGVLSHGRDPEFGNNVVGLVEAINYTIGKYAPNVEFGWQFNLWASPQGGFAGNGVPSLGIVHFTEQLGFEAGKQAIIDEVQGIADYYIAAGVLSNDANFVSIDKYGLDAAGVPGTDPNNPAPSAWFWNHDLWKNYLLFVNTLHESTGLPVTLWQIPVGHINSSQAPDPYNPGKLFPDPINVDTKYEDSAGTFFFGDSFITSGDRLDYFSHNQWEDEGVSTSGNTITWEPNIDDVEAAGVNLMLSGAGVGISTDGVGSPPTDDYWWISKVQEYYQSLGQGNYETPASECDPSYSDVGISKFPPDLNSNGLVNFGDDSSQLLKILLWLNANCQG